MAYDRVKTEWVAAYCKKQRCSLEKGIKAYRKLENFFNEHKMEIKPEYLELNQAAFNVVKQIGILINEHSAKVSEEEKKRCRYYKQYMVEEIIKILEEAV